MKFRKLGNTDLNVSEIGFGAWAIGGSGWGDDCNDDSSMKALDMAWEQGINLYDTCDAYGNGHSEELIGKFVKGKREKTIVVTKGGTNYRLPERSKNFKKEYLITSLEESLMRLQTDYVDVYLLHVPDASWQEKEAVFDTLRFIKKSGKARYCGLAMWGATDTLYALEHDTQGAIEVIECPFNILNKSNREVVEIAKTKQIAILTSQPLASGILTGKYSCNHQFEAGDNRAGFWTKERFESVREDMKIIESCVRMPVKTMTELALAYNLNCPGITCVIPGAKNEEQVEKNVSAGGIELEKSVMDKLNSTRGFIF